MGRRQLGSEAIPRSYLCCGCHALLKGLRENDESSAVSEKKLCDEAGGLADRSDKERGPHTVILTHVPLGLK